MATPIGHALAGYAVQQLIAGRHENRVPLMLLAVAMANAPDLDFLPGLLGGMPALYHRGITHSLGVGLLASLAAALAFRLRGQAFGAAFAVGLLAYASHLALDFFGPDARPPYGQPLLWPLSPEYFHAPIALLPGVRHAPSTSASTLDWVDGILDLHNVGAMAVELIVVAPIAYWAHRQQHPAPPGATVSRAWPTRIRVPGAFRAPRDRHHG